MDFESEAPATESRATLEAGASSSVINDPTRGQASRLREKAAATANVSRSRSRSRSPEEEMRAAGVESPPTLSEHFVGARATRKENYLQRRSFSAPRSAFAARLFPLTVEHTAFWAERAKTAIGKKFASKNSKKGSPGQNAELQYRVC